MAIEWAQDATERAKQDIAYGANKLHRALRRKLIRNPAYWELPHVADKPFVLAVPDFRAPGSMRYLTPILTEHVFGVRHHREAGTGALEVEWLEEHRVGNMREPSGFFRLQGAEGVSAVIAKPLEPSRNSIAWDTWPGLATGGCVACAPALSDGILMLRRLGRDPSRRRSMHPIIGSSGWKAWWCCTCPTGLIPGHNPNAAMPLGSDLLPGACHEFLQPDRTIVSLLPGFHPYISTTLFWMEGETPAEAGDPS